MSSINNNDNNRKVVTGPKSEMPLLREAKKTVQNNAEKNAVEMESGGLNTKVKIGTTEVIQNPAFGRRRGRERDDQKK
jgi:hypothetical protein